jgi:transposase InsO family protein
MDTVLKNLIGSEAYVFIDDIVLFSKSAEEHALRLEHVLERFDKANLQLHPGKCVFAQPRVKYLGYDLSEYGVSASADKVKAVKEYPTPKNVKDVRAFIGLASFYRRLVPNFAEIAKPLTSLTRKNQNFVWGPSQQEAFERMKDKLCTTPVLAYPNFKLPFILTCDASKLAVGAVLTQVQDGAERSIAYASRQLNTAEQSYSATELELLALVWATKYFRCYLYGQKFVVRTDHSALSYLRNFADHNSRLMRWSLTLSGLDFVIQHRPGRKIGHADALSRHVGAVLPEGSLSKESVKHEQEQDEFCMRQNPGALSRNREFFRDDDGVMYRRRPQGKHQVVVPRSMVQRVLNQNHDQKYVAHPGVKRTHDLISLCYWWPGMRKTIAEYVRKCDPCQRRKENCEFTAPLGEVEESKFPFEITSMDITGPYLSTPRKNKYLVTFIDNFTRYVEAFPVPDITSETIARVYATQIVTRHGTGSKLITDQGRNFMSAFFKETCKILGIQKIHTTSLHPQSNGVIERFHRSLHTGLSHYINATNTNWDVLVPFYLMAYRATPNTVTGYSPFYLMHGREMLLPSSDNLKAKISKLPLDHTQRLQNLKDSLKLAYKTVRQANRKSRRKNKKLYDRKAKLRSFQKGDFVYLFNPAVKPGLSRKFHKPWSGPYRITAKISDLNYEIESQNFKKQVVHVNRLKQAYNLDAWEPKAKQKKRRKTREKPPPQTEEEEEEIKIGPFPLLQTIPQAREIEPRTSPDSSPHTPETTPHMLDTPASENRDPTYVPFQTPRSRRELQPTRTEPPITRSRARIVSQDCLDKVN